MVVIVTLQDDDTAGRDGHDGDGVDVCCCS